ncbi:MAG TPA: metalloregulator ArsR/SmtB family transcription factor [Desulfobacteraceae bacterium]|nr:metalloregulator ArsR/SmtB family transcription factor [Desulfobacteraceae bacterium]
MIDKNKNPVDYFKALADDTRVRLINVLSDRELNVNELVAIFEMGQSRISRHLKILADTGLVTVRRDGLWAFYRGADIDQKVFSAVAPLVKTHPRYREDVDKADAVFRMREEESIRFFDAIAEDWDSMKRNIIGAFDLTARISERIPRCKVAADLGCGTGDLLPALLTSADKVIGIDNSPEMLKKASRRFQGEESRVDLRIGQIEHLPLRDSEAGAAVINMVLHHLASPSEGIFESARALEKGGELIIVDLEKHQNESMRSRYGDRWLGFSPDQIKQWAREAGFSVVEQRSFPLRRRLKALFYRLALEPE